MPEKRPSTRRIAAILGLSPMTVSLALRGLPGVSAVTRLRVREKAKELGHYTDPDLVHLSALMRQGRPAGFHSAVAFLNVFPERERTRTEAYLHGLLQGARERAEALGYRVEEFWTRERGMTSRRLSAILVARGIKGVLLPVHADDAMFPALDWTEFMGVALTDSPAVHGLARVAPDNAFAMSLGLSAVAQKGYRRPALLLQPSTDERTRRMHSSVFLRWLQDHQLETSLLKLGDPTAAEFRKWLHVCQPDVVFCPHAEPYGLWWRDFTSSTLMPPAFASLAWSPWVADYAGVDKRTESIGAHGFDFLVAALTRGESGLNPCAPTLHVPGIWRDAASCPRAEERHLLAQQFRLIHSSANRKRRTAIKVSQS